MNSLDYRIDNLVSEISILNADLSITRDELNMKINKFRCQNR
ncbi:hypothetical protein QIA30_05200 (plasmid) [Borreliella turdi]